MTTREDFVEFATSSARPLRAPYTFVPMSSTVLPSPVADKLDLSRPLGEAYCGKISIAWTNETPLLVGGPIQTSDDGETSLSTPVEIDGRYCLPGSTLRGAIRSLVEIAAYGRLTFYDDYVGHTRNFDGYRWRESYGCGDQNTKVEGGWLFEEGGTYRLVKAQVESILIADLVKLIRPGSLSTDSWHMATLDERWKLLKKNQLDDVKLLSTFLKSKGALPAQLILTGPSVGKPATKERKSTFKKKVEHIFVWPSRATDRYVDPTLAKRFLSSLHRDGRTRKPPVANYDALIQEGFVDRFDPQTNKNKPSIEEQMQPGNRQHYGLPVFLHWDKQGKRQIFSLTSMIRAPMRRSLKDVAQDMQVGGKEVPYDLAQALFGWAPPDLEERERQERRPLHPQERGLRSRVQFGFAWLQGEQRPPLLEKDMTPTAPAASFWPFYLRPIEPTKEPPDYDNEDVRLAGRKRYPARAGTQKLPKTSKDKMLQNLQFLREGARFSSEIRVKNITKVELGALVWALTLGQQGRTDRGFRHMIGRAKGFGYGQVKTKISTHSITSAKDGHQADLTAAMEAFEQWVERAIADKCGGDIKPFEQLDEIATLLATTHAETGKALREQHALQFMSGLKGSNEADKILNAYSTVKGAAERIGTTNDKAPPHALDKPTRGDDFFFGLPPYPKYKKQD